MVAARAADALSSPIATIVAASAARLLGKPRFLYPAPIRSLPRYVINLLSGGQRDKYRHSFAEILSNLAKIKLYLFLNKLWMKSLAYISLLCFGFRCP
jgi:hypothetical protein